MAKTALPANAIHPETLADLRAWLSRNHDKEQGTWLVLWKKESGRVRLDYGALVEELLCFGWIDSKPGSWTRTVRCCGSRHGSLAPTGRS